jgi:hypothetical protein
LRRRLLYLAIGALVIVPCDVLTVQPAEAGVETCKTWCLWDQARFSGKMVELTEGACKDYPVRSAANNTADGKTAIFFYKLPGCQGNPRNPFGMRSGGQSSQVNAGSAMVQSLTR